MDEVRYQQESLAQRRLLVTLACHGAGKSLVYSGDVALALQLPHRLVKDRIEACYPALRLPAGQQVQRVRCKRRRHTRQLHGYLLPLPALLQVLIPFKPWASFPLWEWPVLLHACYGDGPYHATLN